MLLMHPVLFCSMPCLFGSAPACVGCPPHCLQREYRSAGLGSMLLDHLERVADSERRFIYTEASAGVSCGLCCVYWAQPFQSVADLRAALCVHRGEFPCW